MNTIMPNEAGELCPVEVIFENTEAFGALLADVVGMVDMLQKDDKWNVEFSARLAGLLAEARRSAFVQGADAMADLLGMPIRSNM